MEEKQKPPCDPDDVICQMEVLRHLQGLQHQLGNDAFLRKYPQLGILKDRISQDVVEQRQAVDQALEECARPSTQAVEEPAPEPPEGQNEL